jgi:hypothetical protein
MKIIGRGSYGKVFSMGGQSVRKEIAYEPDDYSTAIVELAMGRRLAGAKGCMQLVGDYGMCAVGRIGTCAGGLGKRGAAGFEAPELRSKADVWAIAACFAVSLFGTALTSPGTRTRR